MTRAAPHNTEAEISVLGSVLLDNRTMDAIGPLDPDDFYGQRHGMIWRALQALAVRGVPYDTVSLLDALDRLGQVDQAGGPAYLAQLSEAVPFAANAEHYAGIVREKALLRRAIASLSDVVARAYGPVEDARAFLAEAEAAVFALADHADAGEGVLHMRDVVRASMTEIERCMRGDTVRRAITGIAELDGVLGNDEHYTVVQLSPGELTILAARPSMGKSALAKDIALANARQGDGVLVFSLEDSKTRYGKRCISTLSGIRLRRLTDGNVHDDEIEDMTEAADQLFKLPWYLDATPAITLGYMRAKIRRTIQVAGELALVVVDYLQLMTPENPRASREQQVSGLSKGLKAISKEFDLPVLALSQLNRGLESRTDKRPMLADLRHSGSLEQDADVVMFIYRDDVYNSETSDKDVAEILISKQRNGATGRIKTGWDPRRVRFVDTTRIM